MSFTRIPIPGTAISQEIPKIQKNVEITIVCEFDNTGCLRVYLYIFSRKREQTQKHPVLSNSHTIVLSTLFRIFGFSYEMAVRGTSIRVNDIREIDIRDEGIQGIEFGILDCNLSIKI